MTDQAHVPPAPPAYRCNCPNGSYGIKHSATCYEEQLVAARRTAEYWKAEHLAGNAEIERLQRQQSNLIAALGEAQAKIDELSIHAEKWVKRATTPGSLATKLGHVLVNRGIYDRMKDLTQEDTAERVVSDFLALANPIVSEHWHGGQVNQARELAASAYQDGYGAALTDDRDLSERTHELMRQLSRPAHEREPPHCASCSCPPYEPQAVPGCIHDSAPTTLCQVCYPTQPPRDE